MYVKFKKNHPRVIKDIVKGLLNGSGSQNWYHSTRLGKQNRDMNTEEIVEEADKVLIDSAERRRHWQIVRKDTRRILTSMGQ